MRDLHARSGRSYDAHITNSLVIFMMYWAGVYILVVIGAMIPFILLYIVAGALWLSFQTMRWVADKFKRPLTVRKCFLNAHWSATHR